MAKFETIYERIWDNPFYKDGSKKEAKILGEFEIVETLAEDSYTSQKIGVLKDTDRVFIISEFEVTGFNGGSRFEVLECKSLQCRTAYHITLHSRVADVMPSLAQSDTCPVCQAYDWSYHYGIDKMKCGDCGYEA